MQKNGIVKLFCLIVLSFQLAACNSSTPVPSQAPSFTPANTNTITPTATSTPTLTPTLTPTPTATATITPSPTYTPLPTPTAIGGGTGRLILLKAEDSSFKVSSLYTIGQDGTDFARIPVNAEIPIREFYLSPLGSRIIFKSPTGIYTVDVNGTNERLLVEGEDYWPDGWFADGKNFLMNKNNRELYKVNFDTLERTTITTGYGGSFTLSPDQTRIVFSSTGAINLMNADGSDKHRIGSISGFDFIWSPDSQNIIFCACSPTETKIGLVGTDGKAARILVANAHGAGWLNESTILFNRLASSYVYNLSKIKVDGSNQGDLASNKNFSFRSPVFSPDRTKLAFLGGCSANSMCDIFTMNVDGTDVVNITHSPGFYWNVIWQP